MLVGSVYISTALLFLITFVSRNVRRWQLEALRVFGNIFSITFIVAGLIYEAECELQTIRRMQRIT